jgi:hypothetical protein
MLIFDTPITCYFQNWKMMPGIDYIHAISNNMRTGVNFKTGKGRIGCIPFIPLRTGMNFKTGK